MNWAVRAHNEWRRNKLDDVVNFDVKVFEADINNCKILTKESLAYALCRFIPEVAKLDGSDYPGKMLYEMVTSIQKHLHQNDLFWKLLDDNAFIDVKIVLDNVMKERAEQNLGMVKKQADFIPVQFESDLWSKNILGEDTPDKLRDTVLFLLGINLGLCAGDEHYDLRRDTKTKPSQLSFKRASNGKHCLVYREDTVTKTNNGGLKNFKKDCKIIWVYPSKNPDRCPIRLVDKYVSLLPEVRPRTKKFNFYLRSLEKPNPAQWYGEQVVGRHTLTKVVGKLLKVSDLDGFFSNHSLRRTSTTRLFQAGVDRKIIKEFTGHVSDVVDRYQVMSDEEKESLSKILRGNKTPNETEKLTENADSSLEVVVKNSPTDRSLKCSCSCSKSKVNIQETEQIGSMINTIITNCKSRKASIKIEI